MEALSITKGVFPKLKHNHFALILGIILYWIDISSLKYN